MTECDRWVDTIWTPENHMIECSSLRFDRHDHGGYGKANLRDI